MSVCYYPKGVNVNDTPIISEYDKSGKPIRSTENLAEGLHWLNGAIMKAEAELDLLRRDKRAILEEIQDQRKRETVLRHLSLICE